MADGSTALGPPLDTEPPKETATDTVTPNSPDAGKPIAGTTIPNPFEPVSMKGLDDALDMVLNNYGANQDIARQQSDYAAQVQKAGADYAAHLPERKELLGKLRVPEITPAPKMAQRSPLEALGTWGAVIGGLGGLFSRRPMTAAIKAMAAGADSLYKGDVDAFNREYKTWDDQTQLALKQADLENGIVKSILDDDSKSWDQKLNLLKAYGSSLNDKLLVTQAERGNIQDLFAINTQKIAMADKLRDRAATMTPESLIMWNFENQFQQQNGRPPTAEERFANLTKFKPDLSKEAQRNAMLSVDTDWQSGDPVRMRQAYQRTEVAMHPIMSQYGFGQPQMVLTRDAAGNPKTVLAQFQPGTGQWVTADETRSPITTVERILPQGSPSPDDPSVKDIAKRISNYEMAPPSGYALREPYWQAVMSQVGAANPQYDAAQYPARSKAVQAFSTGKEGAAIRSFNTAIDHLATLEELGNNLNNTNSQSFNKAANKFAQEFGAPAPTSFEAAKQIVGQEIVKAIVAGGGGVGEREEAARHLASANSPAQLSAVIKTYKALMGGQLRSLKKQYEDTTGLKNFDERLTGEAKEQLSSHSGSASLPYAARAKLSQGKNTTFGNGQVWTLDANGDPVRVR